jgi:deazaflavin-dependent oxidoreductase (nitroreductase family)
MRPLNRRLSTRFGEKLDSGNLVLVLTTIGRKSGLPRQTPLQYEEDQGIYYVGSARGQSADWFCNLVANPHVQIQVEGSRLDALAEPITDPARVADFLELRLRRRPKMMRLMLRAEGLPANFGRTDLERLAGRIAVVAFTPCKEALEQAIQG